MDKAKTISNFNKLILHPAFTETVTAINKLNIRLPSPKEEEVGSQLHAYPSEGKLITNLEEIKNYTLDAAIGRKLIDEGLVIAAYDESINTFAALEGVAYLIGHSLIMHHDSDYLPSLYLTVNFYTRSKHYAEKSLFVKYTDDFQTAWKTDYVTDRSLFITENTPNNSVLLIDGPLIGGQMSSHTFALNQALLKKDVIPIFCVKNSSSNLVTDNLDYVKGKFNSDLHWAFTTLKPGERTNFFRYEDLYNKNNAKVFCYFKAFNASPQRIEFHAHTFEKYKELIPTIMHLIFYLSLVQGNPKDPQVRPIAIAEKYAREALHLVNLYKLIRGIGLTPTINQERFGGAT